MAEKDAIATGVALYRQRSYKDALAHFLSLSDTDNIADDKMDLPYYIGLCYMRLEHYEDALLYIEQLVTVGKDENRILQCRYLLAVMYVFTGRTKLARFELDKLIEAGYHLSSVYASLAYISWRQKDADACIGFYRKALANDPNNVTALNGLGYVLACQNKDLTEALALCKHALDMDPNSAVCMDSLGWVYYRLGLFREAERYTRRAAGRLGQNNEVDEHLRLILENRNNV